MRAFVHLEEVFFNERETFSFCYLLANDSTGITRK